MVQDGSPRDVMLKVSDGSKGLEGVAFMMVLRLEKAGHVEGRKGGRCCCIAGSKEQRGMG